MTRFPFDQFSKDYLKELLSPLGTVETSQDVPAEVREIDVRFTPTSISPEYIQQLGLLGQIATQPALLEPYRNPATTSEVRSCITKLFDVHTQLERRAKREEIRLDAGKYPTLWVLTPTASTALLESWGAVPAESGWQQGIYFLPSAWKTAIAVIHQLPAVPETLWLRILGKGRVQQRAIAELAALPEANPQRSTALELLYNLQAHLAANQAEVDAEDRELIMALAPLYQEQIAAAVEQGIEQGIERGIERGIEQGQRLILENLLRVRFNEIDDRMPSLIESLSGLPPEQFTLFLLQLSQLENDLAGRKKIPRLAVESLLELHWGELELGEDREVAIQAILALSTEKLSEFLSQLSQRSKAEVLAQLKG